MVQRRRENELVETWAEALFFFSVRRYFNEHNNGALLLRVYIEKKAIQLPLICCHTKMYGTLATRAQQRIHKKFLFRS